MLITIVQKLVANLMIVTKLIQLNIIQTNVVMVSALWCNVAEPSVHMIAVIMQILPCTTQMNVVLEIAWVIVVELNLARV